MTRANEERIEGCFSLFILLLPKGRFHAVIPLAAPFNRSPSDRQTLIFNFV